MISGNVSSSALWMKEEESRRRRARAFHFRAVWLLRLGLLVLVLGGWQVASDMRWIDPFFASSPLAVCRYLAGALVDYSFWADTGITILEALISCVAGSLAGVLLGFFLSQTRLFRDALRPLFVIMNSMPRVALAPLLIIWFGLGIWSKIAVGFSLTFFVVLNGTLVGVDNVDPDLKVLSRQLGLSRRQIFYKVVLPSSVSSIFSALNLGLVYGFLGVVVAEMLAAPRGLGHLLQSSAGLLRTDAVLGIVLFLALLVTLLVIVLDKIESMLLCWRAQ